MSDNPKHQPGCICEYCRPTMLDARDTGENK